jgi:predicted small secreted protein
MGRERLTGLYFMYIHKDININSENNLKNMNDRFSKENNQNLTLDYKNKV